MDDDMPDIPLDNFGADTEAIAPPAVEEQTAPETEATGSEDVQEAQPETTEDNSKAESDTDGAETTGRPEKKDRLQARFGELTGKVKSQDEYIQRLEADMARYQAMQQVQPLQPDENGYIDPQALQQQQTQIAQATVQGEMQALRTQMERSEIANRFAVETKEVLSTYPMLDENSPEYDEAVANAVGNSLKYAIEPNLNNTAFLRQISPKQIVAEYMNGINAVARKAQSKTQQNLKDLQAESAVIPEGAPSKADDDSIEALEAKLENIKF